MVGELIFEIVLELMLAFAVPCTSMARTENPVVAEVLVIPLIVFPVIVLEVAPSGFT